MPFDFFLSDYTTHKALLWGNFIGHCHKAYNAPTLSQKVAHTAMATLQAIPVLGQAVSLAEMAAFHHFGTFTHLMQQKISPITPCEDPLIHRKKINKSSPITSLTIPQNATTEDYFDSVFFMHRSIEQLYLDLPWPQKIQKILIYTMVSGGKGDICAAAKAISLMQRICPTLDFDWVLRTAFLDQYNPGSFLQCEDLTKIHIRDGNLQNPVIQDPCPIDLVIQGPVNQIHNKQSIATQVRRPVAGPMLHFLENADKAKDLDLYTKTLQTMLHESLSNAEIYQTRLHSFLFPSESIGYKGLLPMGLAPGSGVFLDQSRIQAPLSRGYCCPLYLAKIQDKSLQSDIYQSMNIFHEHETPNYDEYSFNSGYAHHPISWAKFIDCVAIHEKTKHVTIVLNQNGEFAKLSAQEFQDTVFTPSRISLLKQKGYTKIVLKGKHHTAIIQESNATAGRRLVVILRPSFMPNDMKCMQLASERLLTTGDNSATEAWCAKCKLYLYEDCDNMNCKWRFLQQQVDLAQTISPQLARLLALFGGDQRLEDPCLNEPLNEEKMHELERLLGDADLGSATLKFCDKICQDFSFEKVLEASLKRTVWSYCLPELTSLEANALTKNFGESLVASFKQPERDHTLQIPDLSQLKQQIFEAVQEDARN